MQLNRRQFVKATSSALMLAFTPWHGVQAKQQKLRGYIRTNWSQDPFAYGSYSYVAKAANRRDIHALEKPVANKLFFAGEATFSDYNSTVHAAHESGLKAADKILAAKHKKVAIIGAGMSGLTVAHALSKENVAVTVFEARDRIGGRVWTDKRLGFPLDLGASWIHGIDGNPLTALAKQQQQTTVPTDDSYIIRGRDGRKINEHDAPDWLEEVVSIQHEAGAGSDQLNRLSYLFLDDYDGDEVIFPNGYADIFEAFKGDYQLRLNTTVTEVQLTDNGAYLTLNSQKAQHFDAVLVSVPLGVLKQNKIRFSPALPARKQTAIERLGMGTLDKVYLWFDQPFWDTDTTWIATPENGLPPGQFNQWLNLYRYIGQPVVMAFNGGNPALSLAKLHDEALVSKAQNTIYSAYGIKNGN